MQTGEGGGQKSEKLANAIFECFLNIEDTGMDEALTSDQCVCRLTWLRQHLLLNL